MITTRFLNFNPLTLIAQLKFYEWDQTVGQGRNLSWLPTTLAAIVRQSILIARGLLCKPYIF